MTASEIATFKRAVENLKLEHKTHLTRQEIDRVVQELSMSREYKLADYIRSLDAATIASLLR
jgi:hypothetical protein